MKAAHVFAMYEAYLAGYVAKLTGGVPRVEVDDDANEVTRATIGAALALGLFDGSKPVEPDGARRVAERVTAMVPEL